MNTIRKAGFLFSLLRARCTGKAHPVTVSVCVTGKCNGQCAYCCGPYPRTEASRALSHQQLLDLIDYLAAGGTRYISLSGGEPLLRDDIGALVRHAQSKGCFCNVDTNGFLLPEKIRELEGVDAVAVSLDGPPDVHDALRGKGSHERAMKGITAALAAGLPIELGAVLTRFNAERVDDLAAIGHELGVRIKWMPVFAADIRRYREDLSEIRAPDNKLREAFGRIVALKRRGAPFLYSTGAFTFALQWPDYSIPTYVGFPPEFRHPRCMAGTLRCHVESDGTVYPCCHHVGSFPARSILDVGFAEALRHAVSVNTCRACFDPGAVDHNRMMNLHVPTIISQVRDALCTRSASSSSRPHIHS